MGIKEINLLVNKIFNRGIIRLYNHANRKIVLENEKVNKKVTGNKVISLINKIFGGNTSKKPENPKYLELALGLPSNNSKIEVFLPKDTRLPASRRKIYYTER